MQGEGEQEFVKCVLGFILKFINILRCRKGQPLV